MATEEIPPAEAIRIWRNGRIPVVYRPGGQEYLLVRLPLFQRVRHPDGSIHPQNIIWLRGERKRRIDWNRQFRAWEIVPSRFNDVVDRCLNRYGSTYVIQQYRPLEKCAPACWNAEGYHCECSCLGANHGSGIALKHVVSETFAFEWGNRQLAVRLLRLN